MYEGLKSCDFWLIIFAVGNIGFGIYYQDKLSLIIGVLCGFALMINTKE